MQHIYLFPSDISVANHLKQNNVLQVKWSRHVRFYNKWQGHRIKTKSI